MQAVSTDNGIEIQDPHLNVAAAAASTKGTKPINEDAAAYKHAENAHQLESKGVCLLIADGVSSAEAGKEASETCVNSFIQEYFQTPETWSVSHAGQKILTGINLKLFKKSHEFAQQEKGYLCTFSGLVLKSRIGHFFHAGDSRIYQLREGKLTKLTRDHTVNLGGGKNILARAVGMDSSLQIDYGKVSLQQGDVFLLSTDGIHDFVEEDDIVKLLSSNGSEQSICDQLIKSSLSNSSDDNISCVVARVTHLPNESLDDYNSKLTRLPFPPPLEPGMNLDGYRIDKELFASSRSQVYLVTDTQSNQQMVMKTPSVNFQDDVRYIDRFIQEEWIGKRINSPHVVSIIEQTRPRNFLYYLMEFVPGISLEKWMHSNKQRVPKVAIHIIRQVADALQSFHDTETIHQDLKPGNILIDENNHIKVVDFGSVFVAGIAEIFVPLDHEGVLGTATYSDPQYLLGKNSGVQGDIYALATITYELFCGHLPYGAKIEQCTTAFEYDRLRYHRAADFNPIIPIWFDRALEKGVAIDLNKRYRNMDEFVRDITQPNPEFLHDDPQLESNKGLLFWQMMSGFWILMLVVVVMFFTSN